MGRLGGYNLDRFLKSRAAAEPIRMELRIGGDILVEILVTMDGSTSGESCREVVVPPDFPIWVDERLLPLLEFGSRVAVAMR